LQILAAGALSGMSEARAALIFWFFFIKEKEHPPAALRAHTPPLAKNTPPDCFVAARLAMAIMAVISFCLFEEYPPCQ
jgi:hypothetical protein